ncbi:hypothetical protein C8Q78DRAFT_1076252 [Trametes maxima]|nr:hypothetical protein C8Q78DRAFT_1076252 [Trametes maxima]
MSSMTTCGNATIPWSRAGPPQGFAPYAPTAPLGAPDAASRCVPSAKALTWHPVDVTPGDYECTSLDSDISHPLSRFLAGGSVDPCLTPPFLSNSGTSSPYSMSSHVTVGALVGAIVGSCAFLAAAVGALVYFRLRRQTTPAYRWGKDDVGDPGTWNGLSSHVNVNAQRPLPSLPREAATASIRLGKEDVPLSMMPRLEPNRRKPSLSSVTLTSFPSTPPPKESGQRSTQGAASPPPVVRLDRELPLPPTSYVPSVDHIRGSQSFSPTDREVIVWLRRHTSVQTPLTRRPSGVSAVPSSRTSQMYRGRDSLWATAPRTPEIPAWACRDPNSPHYGARSSNDLRFVPDEYRTPPLLDDGAWA